MTKPDHNDDSTQTHVVLTEGTSVGHYRIVRKIGAGGMGDVFLAQDSTLDRKTVLKFLPAHLATNATFKARFKREAQAAAALNHPNIITIYEVGEFSGWPFMAIEFVDGQDLSQLLAGGKVDFDSAFRIFLQVCTGLSKAHQRGIIHRDVKPGNIMIDADGQVKILDFGLARHASDSQLTQVGTVLGTSGYMSPEQGQGLEVDFRSDIFSVGIVLYELLTGESPFLRANIPATIHAVVHDEPKPLSEFNLDLPEACQQIVSRALAKTPDDRYQSMSEIVKEIHAFLGQPLTTSLIMAPPQPVARVQSLAVLHLRNLGSAENDFLSYGITEDLIVDLTRIGSLRVAPMRSIMRFLNSDADLAEIAAKLDVAYILDGSIHKAGTTVRVSAQLIEVATDKNLWAERWEEAADNLPRIKQALAEGVGQALGVDDAVVDAAHVGTPEASNPQAYEYYLRGKYAFDHKKDTADVEVALGLYRQALAEEPELAAAHHGVAEILTHKGHHQRAIDELTPALESSRQKGLRAAEGKALVLMAWAHIHLSRWDEARTLCNQALDIARSLGDLAGEADVINVLIDINRRRAEFDQALKHFDRVLEICLQQDDQDRMAEAYKNIGNVHFRRGDYPQAREVYEKSLGIARVRDNRLLDAKCICNIGLTHLHTGRIDDSLGCFDRALQMYRQLGDRTGQANALNNLALAHSARGGFRKAVGYDEQAATLQRDLGDRGDYALVCCNLSRHLAILGEYDRGIEVAEEALAIADSLDYPFVANLANDTLGYCYYCRSDMNEAAERYAKALVVAEQSGLRREEALARSSLGEIYCCLDDHESCVSYCSKALSLANEVGCQVASIRATTYLAVETIRAGKYDPGLKQLREVLEDARRFGDPRYILCAQRMLAKMMISFGGPEDQTEGVSLLKSAAALAVEREVAHEIRLCRSILDEMKS